MTAAITDPPRTVALAAMVAAAAVVRLDTTILNLEVVGDGRAA